MRTLQQQSQDAYDPVQRGKSREKTGKDQLNTIQHRKTSQQRQPKTSAAANILKQGQIFKQSIEQENPQRSRQSSQGPQIMSAENSTQGQGGRQATTSSLVTQGKAQGTRGTTPLRMGKQNTAKNTGQGIGQIPQKVGSAQPNLKKQHPQTTQNITTKGKTNNQQIKGIMAAALASVKANPTGTQATLPQGIAKSQQKLNNQDLISNRQDQFMNFGDDDNDLKILKANSVNNKYMTELIQGQKIMPEDMRAPAAARDAGSEYINTDEEEDNNGIVMQKQVHSSPLRQSAYKHQKSEERKVFSQQDYNEIQNREEFNQFPMGNIGTDQERGRSSQARPQSSYLPKHYSVERGANPVSKNPILSKEPMRKKEPDDILRLLQKNETSQNQLNQRLDIFEEEIIKRVREIQKYSKGLNSILRKSVMPDLLAVQEKVMSGPTERMVLIEDQIIQIQQQIEMQKVVMKNTQLNIGTDMNTRFSLIEEKIQKIKAPQGGSGDGEIQQKLVEQNQLIGMLDEQLNSQEQQIQQMQQSIAERDEHLIQMIQNQKPAQSEDPTDFNALLNEFEESITSQIQLKFGEIEAKMGELETNQLKQLEDSEGRDGLILQQNQDITNLYQADEQILENEKAFKVQIESMEAQMLEIQENNELLIQNQGNTKNDSQIEGLKHNIEGRLQICIKQLKEEMLQISNKMNDSLSYKIDQIQQYTENQEPKLQKLNSNFQNFQQNFESLELQFQAQFDEQNSQQDQRLKKMEKIIGKGSGGGYQEEIKIILERIDMLESYESPQQIELILQKIDALESQESPQIELILQKIDQLEDQQDLDLIFKRIDALEKKDVFAVFETKMSPYKNQIEDLQIEITSKCLELSTQQDTQVNSLILEIKQIQENFEQLQDIVVQTTQDVQVLGQNDMSDALAQSKIEIEKFRGHFEAINDKMKAQIFEVNTQIQEIKSQSQSQKQVTASPPSMELKKLEEEFKNLKYQLDTLEDQLNEPNKDVLRLERKNEEIEIQLKNIYAQNTKEFESLKTQMGQYSRKSEIPDKFEDVSRRTSDVRKDLQTQVDELVMLVQEIQQEPKTDGNLQGQLTQMEEQIEEIAMVVQQMQQEPKRDVNLEAKVTKMQEDLVEVIKDLQNNQKEPEKDVNLEMKISQMQEQVEDLEMVVQEIQKVPKADGNLEVKFTQIEAQVDELQMILQNMQKNEQKPNTDGNLAVRLTELESKIQGQVDDLFVVVQELQNNPSAPKNDGNLDFKFTQIEEKLDIIGDLKQAIKILDEDFIEIQSQVKGFDIQSQKLETLNIEFKALSSKVTEIQNKISLDQKSANAKFDVISMDISSLRNFEKITRTSTNDIIARLDTLEKLPKQSSSSSDKNFNEILQPFSDDILTMKHLINILQDSNFQAQIDEIKRSISDAKMRFSMPMPKSSMNVQEDEEVFQSSKKSSKKAPQVSSKKPRDLDLSPIGQGQKSQKQFQETDDDLQDKLQNMFPEKSEKQGDQEFDEDEIQEYDHDDFENLPSERKKEETEEDHEQLYEQEVQLPILQEKSSKPMDSFQNSSKSKVDDQTPKDQSEVEAVSINSIDLDLMSEEQKQMLTNKIMLELDFDKILQNQVEDVIQAIIMRQ